MAEGSEFAHPMGEAKRGPLPVGCDRRLKLEFHGSEISSDAGLLSGDQNGPPPDDRGPDPIKPGLSSKSFLKNQEIGIGLGQKLHHVGILIS